MKKEKTQFGSIIDEGEKPTEEEMKRRRQRFATHSAETSTPVSSRDLSQPIVGTCCELEKSYFRLTSEVDPSKIRPEPVLKEALHRLKKIWKKEDRKTYVMDQLKAIRQDLVVQGINDEFTVKVYEFNVKCSIVCHDLNELNQCQSMLSKLYKTIPSPKSLRFLSYNILYDVIMHNTLDIHHHLVVAQHHLTERCIQHALLVVDAVRSIDYLYYLKLMETAPKYGRVLLQLYLPTIRRHALKLYLSSLFPSIEVAQLAFLLQISNEECLELLQTNGIVATDRVDIKANRAAIQQMSF